MSMMRRRRAEEPSIDFDPQELTGLFAAPRWLRDLGFTDVDCLWKWRELALLTAVKPG